jgi:very-short-patch-repair endonuclease
VHGKRSTENAGSTATAAGRNVRGAASLAAFTGAPTCGHSFKRQQPIGRFIVDFICLRSCLIIEVDGEHHAGQADADRERTEFLEALGYTVLRFSNQEAPEQTAAVLERIRRGTRPPPPGLPKGEGASG